MPDNSNEYMQGYRAYGFVNGIGSNPYREDTNDYDDWDRGYMDAAADDDRDSDEA